MPTLEDLQEKYGKKEVQEEKKDSKTEELEVIEPPTPKVQKTLPAKNIEESEKPQISGYKPHGTDIMTTHKLITGKSIRKYKGKGTNIALLEGLIQECMKLKKKWSFNKTA